MHNVSTTSPCNIFWTDHSSQQLSCLHKLRKPITLLWRAMLCKIICQRFKVRLPTSQKFLFYLRQWKPFKNDEKCLLFHVKSFFRSGQQIFKMHILSNISRSKDSQIMKFGQLIEYNVKNIFFEKPYTQCGGEASSRPFYKNQNWA